MRQTLKACVFVAAASGVIGASGSAAYADAGAGGGARNSPGVLSGNSIQVTVDTPVNACGNSVDAGAALNPAMGNACGNGAPAVRQAPPAQHAPVARPPAGAEQAPGVHWTAPEREHRAEPVRRPVPERAERPVAAPAERAPEHLAGHARGPVPRPAPQEERVDAVARAGASAGSALLAATGADELGAVAAVGGGLLVGGALLLRRSRTRR
ncbi:chaplin [Streptomyces platensis]|uniref:chaplin n=1 Tax=Streptomyces platensis TaxID=58346 RepID=UPI001F160FC1|nr:chaplin [Streptomyces platensis]